MHSNVGVVLLTLGDQEGALREFAAARAIDEEAVPDSPRHATDLFQLGGVHAMRGELAAALRYLTRALEIDESGAPDSPAAGTCAASTSRPSTWPDGRWRAPPGVPGAPTTWPTRWSCAVRSA